MTFELRTYTATPGRLDDLLTRFREHTVALFAAHSMESIGYWTKNDESEQLVYVLRHTGDPAANWAAFVSDPGWIEAKANSLVNGEIVAHIDSVFVTATDFSAIQ